MNVNRVETRQTHKDTQQQKTEMDDDVVSVGLMFKRPLGTRQGPRPRMAWLSARKIDPEIKAEAEAAFCKIHDPTNVCMSPDLMSGHVKCNTFPAWSVGGR